MIAKVLLALTFFFTLSVILFSLKENSAARNSKGETLLKDEVRPLNREPSNPTGNLLVNPGFELGLNPWFSMESWNTQFTLSNKHAHSGTTSAVLSFRDDLPSTTSTQVTGVVQEISPEKFPEKISGAYYVEDWKPGLGKQYLQFVVIVFDAKNIPSIAEPSKNHQLRFVLSDLSQDPFEITNAKFVFLNSEPVQKGQWVSFERNIADDFVQKWGEIPQGYSKIRVFFEMRYEGYQANQPIPQGKTYFDDLFIGTP